MAEINHLHPDLSTDLSVFTLKIGLQNLSFSVDFIGLRHNSSIICCRRIFHDVTLPSNTKLEYNGGFRAHNCKWSSLLQATLCSLFQHQFGADEF